MELADENSCVEHHQREIDLSHRVPKFFDDIGGQAPETHEMVRRELTHGVASSGGANVFASALGALAHAISRAIVDGSL